MEDNNFKSQQNEDRILYEEIFSKIVIKNPTYLEMGAMNGIDYSNTYFFEHCLNWKGILIEPHPYNYKNLVKNRPNNYLYNNLVSNAKESQEFMYYDTFTLSAVSGIINTLPEQNIKTYFENDNTWQNSMREKYLKKELIIPKTLTEIVKDSQIEKIDFFSLDVEGHEYSVLESYDWKVPINTFLIENNQDTGKVHNLLKEKGYIYIKNIGCNSFFIHKDFIREHEYLRTLLNMS